MCWCQRLRKGDYEKPQPFSATRTAPGKCIPISMAHGANRWIPGTRPPWSLLSLVSAQPPPKKTVFTTLTFLFDLRWLFVACAVGYAVGFPRWLSNTFLP